jgi:hypothetical protein
MRHSILSIVLVALLLVLPACRSGMNERIVGSATGAGTGILLGAVFGGSLPGAVLGGVAGAVAGYIVGDYFADQRERQCCTPQSVPYDPSCAPCPRTSGEYPQSMAYTAPASGTAWQTVRVPPAEAAFQRGRHAASAPEARRSFEEALRLDPSHVEALNGLGVNQLVSGDRRAAIASFQKALRIDPGHYGARANLQWAEEWID